MSTAHFFISIKSKISTLPILSYYSVVLCLRCLLRDILSVVAYTYRDRDFVFIIIVQFVMNANSRIRFGLQIVYVTLYITPSHYYILETYLKTLNL